MMAVSGCMTAMDSPAWSRVSSPAPQAKTDTSEIRRAVRDNAIRICGRPKACMARSIRSFINTPIMKRLDANVSGQARQPKTRVGDRAHQRARLEHDEAAADYSPGLPAAQ